MNNWKTCSKQLLYFSSQHLTSLCLVDKHQAPCFEHSGKNVKLAENRLLFLLLYSLVFLPPLFCSLYSVVRLFISGECSRKTVDGPTRRKNEMKIDGNNKRERIERTTAPTVHGTGKYIEDTQLLLLLLGCCCCFISISLDCIEKRMNIESESKRLTLQKSFRLEKRRPFHFSHIVIVFQQFCYNSSWMCRRRSSAPHSLSREKESAFERLTCLLR